MKTLKMLFLLICMYLTTAAQKELKTFQIPITYRGKELQLDAQLLQLGYIRKIHVDVNSIIVFIEKDDEGNYRAVRNDLKS